MAINLFHFSAEGRFFKELDLIKRYPGVPAKIVLFLLDKRYDVVEIIKDNMKNELFDTCSKKLEDEEKILFECNLAPDEESKDDKAYFLISKKNPVALFISNQKGKRFKATLGFFYGFYPLLSRIFLRSYQMLSMLHDIEKENKLDLIAKSYVAKRYFGKKKSEVCYERISYQRAFEQAIEDNLWIDSILLDLMKSELKEGSVRLSRKGILSYYSMDFSSFYSLFIEPLMESLIEVYNVFFVNKSRTIESPEPKPITIKLNEDVFKKEDSITLFINQLRKDLTRWGFSIFNKDENFLHLMLHDYESGSSYDILISSYNEIKVIPQTQVIPSSINRLIGFLLDNYEGELENV